MKTTLKTPLFNPNLYAPLAADVSKAKSNYACEIDGSLHEAEASNERSDILETIGRFRRLAREGGREGIVLVLEPTGGYERPLVRAARALGVEVFYAGAEAVKRLQVVQDGTSSKSDRKDARTILTLAKVGRLMRCRDLSGRWQALRQMNVHHDRLETSLARLKGRARRLLDELFPGLDFSAQWFFGPAAMALARLYSMDPYAMRAAGFANAAARMRRAGLRARTVGRVVAAARAAVETGLDRACSESLAIELAEVYGEIGRAAEAKRRLESRFEALYDELLEAGEVRVRPVPLVLPKARLAMLYGETGPLEDFQSHRQLRRYAGMNVRLRESGTYSGARRLSKKGRPLLRKILTQTCLPLVRKGELYGEEYHARKARGAPGKKAMAAIAGKHLRLLFGLHGSASAFDPTRVFACSSEHLAAAA